jgi:SpoVK/Ycf46/Vps4 family AAA+-type ATPase
MSHAATLCRRRWAYRGRSLGDFVFGFTLAGLSHILAGLWRLSRWACRVSQDAFWRNARGSRTSVGSNLRREVNRVVAGEQLLRNSVFVPLAEKPHVRFSDVAGLDEAKRDIMLRMVLPLQYPDKARAVGVRRGGGLLLYGPPGTGKTLLAKAVATELDCPFYQVRPPDIMSHQVGDAEKNVQRLFQTVRANSRAVLFLDEVEALVPSRRRNGSTIMARVISQFLTEIDGLSSSSDRDVLLLIGATNEPDMLDQAMLRPGRFDAKVYVGPPNASAREQILRLCLKNRPVSEDVHVPLLVQMTEGKTGAEIRSLVQQAEDRAFLRSIREGESATPIITEADFESSIGAAREESMADLSAMGRQMLERSQS